MPVRNISLAFEKQKAAPCFILVRPQMAENIGMAARAMMNCGIDEMRLVCPRESPLDAKALSASSGAERILKSAQIFHSLSEAVQDLTYVVATTARDRDMVKPVQTADQAMSMLHEKSQKGHRTGILFGCERTGLLNEELALADNLLTIPLNPEHTSLNLSQAVLLVGYEYFKLCQASVFETVKEKNTPASKEEIARLLAYLEDLLQARGYFRLADKKPRMLLNLNNIFVRADLTEQEVRTLHGVLNHLIRMPE